MILLFCMLDTPFTAHFEYSSLPIFAVLTLLLGLLLGFIVASKLQLTKLCVNVSMRTRSKAELACRDARQGQNISLALRGDGDVGLLSHWPPRSVHFS